MLFIYYTCQTKMHEFSVANRYYKIRSMTYRIKLGYGRAQITVQNRPLHSDSMYGTVSDRVIQRLPSDVFPRGTIALILMVLSNVEVLVFCPNLI